MHPLVDRAELLAGMTRWALARQVQSGELRRAARGVYTTQPGGRMLDAGATARARRGVLSGCSAARVYDVPILDCEITHITVPRSRSGTAPAPAGVRLHRFDLAAHEIAVVNGVRVTSPLRTCIDLAVSLPLVESLPVIDAFLHKGLVRRAELRQALLARRGATALAGRRVAALMDERSESVLETLCRLTLLTSTLPPPTTQFVVRRGGVFLARVDFAWPEARVLLECDGREVHEQPAAFGRDRRRWSALAAEHYYVLIVTWADVVHDPSYVVALVATALAKPRSEPVIQPTHDRSAA